MASMPLLDGEAKALTLEGRCPPHLRGTLAAARKNFSWIFGRDGGEALDFVPAPGFMSVRCAQCGGGSFLYKTKDGQCRAYCLGCGHYYGYVPQLKNAWKRDGGRRKAEAALRAAAASLDRADAVPVPAAQSGGQAVPQAPEQAGSPSGLSSGCRIMEPIPFIRTPPGDWPGPWQSAWARTKPGWLCWTYWDLGQDLLGTPDPERRRVLAQMIAGLGRPAGTHAFWPCALPASTPAGAAPDRNVFWSGVREIGARAVVVLGSRAGTAIGLPQGGIRPLHWEIRSGVIVCTAWDFFRIAEQPSRTDGIVQFLASLFNDLRL